MICRCMSLTVLYQYDITKKSDMSITVIYHTMSLTVLYSDDLIQMLKNKLVQRYKKCWAGIISDIANNQTWKFKTYIYKEKYLSVIKNREVRKCVTALRISAHQLEIEMGRYKNVPLNSRICKLCKSNEVEDEVHFLP